MQVSDIILGLLIILLVGWTMLLAIEQRGMTVSLRALELQQSGQALGASPDKCHQLAGYTLIQPRNFNEKEYYTTVGFDPDLNQSFFCFYETA